MKPRFLIFAFVLTLQSAWILATTFTQERILSLGKPVRLETRPVDPRDLIRGDYLILNYKISDVRVDQFTPPPATAPQPGTTVFVSLEPRGEFYEISVASTDRASLAGSAVILKGQVQNGWGGSNSQTVRLNYGLERFYVREGTGNPRGKLTVEVAVPDSGQGRIKEVFLDGKPYAQAMQAEAR